MSSAKENKSIAKLIVGAMTIDGSLDKAEREKVARTLKEIGMAELIADVGAAIEEDDGNFDMFSECKTLMSHIGASAHEVTPLIFRVVCDVVASDRFVSAREASYLSALSKRLDLTMDASRGIFRQVLADRRGRLEISASSVDPELHPNLKELLSFSGAESLVGAAAEGSFDDILDNLEQSSEHDVKYTREDLLRALAVLGLESNAQLEDAEAVWKETINNLDLPKMADLGETFVSAAINRITRINDAFKMILQYHGQIKK